MGRTRPARCHWAVDFSRSSHLSLPSLYCRNSKKLVEMSRTASGETDVGAWRAGEARGASKSRCARVADCAIVHIDWHVRGRGRGRRTALERAADPDPSPRAQRQRTQRAHDRPGASPSGAGDGDGDGAADGRLPARSAFRSGVGASAETPGPRGTPPPRVLYRRLDSRVVQLDRPTATRAGGDPSPPANRAGRGATPHAPWACRHGPWPGHAPHTPHARRDAAIARERRAALYADDI